MSEVKNICIIDDDKIYTYGVKKIIRNHLPDNQVTTYENGKLALQAFSELKQDGKKLPDLILLDIDMPEMNGWDFLRQFEKVRNDLSQNIEVFVISSRVKESKQELYKVEWDQQVKDFIQKPVHVDALKKLLS